MSLRPQRLVVVTGTGTEIGKTWVTAAVARHLVSLGHKVAARKPAQSFSPGDTIDAAVLAAATGEDPDVVCPPERNYHLPLAPPMAAEALGRPAFRIVDLCHEVSASWPADRPDIGVVEGAGGVASPQAADGDMTDLIAALAPDLVVVVADGALGTINLVRLCLRALGDQPVAVHLNRFEARDDLHRRNRAWLVERDGLEVTTEIAPLAERVMGAARPVGR